MDERRFGLGFDSHPRARDRPLVLGGVGFNGEGLAGHSDGDVIAHALSDALLGAAALGDLGEHFPDSDPRWAGISGPGLIRRTVELLREAGLAPESCDVVLIADNPRIGSRRGEMRAALADALEIPLDRVSVKATRPEGLGLSGDGAACLALAVLHRR